MLSVLLFLLVGIFAGFAAGLLGVGGGIINVPALDWIFLRQGIDPSVTFHMALGTSLAIVVVTSSSAVFGHHKRRMIIFPVAWRAGVAGIAGVVLGGCAASLLSAEILRPAFGVLMLVAAIKLFVEKTPEGDGEHMGKSLALAIGFGAGVASGFFGIGGGIIAVPLFIWLGRLNPRHAVATSSLMIVIIATFGAGTYVATGYQVTADVPHSLGYVHWLALIFVAPLSILTARLGVWIAHTIDPRWLKALFAVALFIVGIRFVLFAFQGGSA
ncbi:MAG: sulfite exporter TauE/SafE family protein [Candidatus Lernaella stagnicola]|nr:sulfite exporter TauE/SafE family protein [Candidatus Lernaella stagnicola]